MANRVLVLENGKSVTVEGSANGQVLTWTEDTNTASFSAPSTSGTVTSVGLTGGTSGIVIGGATSPITTSGTYNLDAPLRFALDTTTPTAVAAAGQVAWNDTEGSIDSMLKGGNVVLSVGQQIYQRVVNADSVPLTKGMVVYVFGSSGTRISVKRALADADLTSAAILGVVAESIAVSASGFVMTSGLMKNLGVLKPADGFDDGDVVYLSPTTPGALTVTKPVAPQHLVTVGYVAKSSSGTAGELLVHPQNGYELEELHDVLVSSPTSGQILVYDATTGQNVWKNASLTGSGGVTVTPGAGSLALSLDLSAIPYDLPAEIPGTPDVSKKVVNFKAVRAFTLAATGHQGGQLSAPSGNFVCTVQKNGSSIGTITFGTSSFSSSVTATSFAAGDVLSVETPGAALGIDTPFFTLSMTLA